MSRQNYSKPATRPKRGPGIEGPLYARDEDDVLYAQAARRLGRKRERREARRAKSPRFTPTLPTFNLLPYEED